MYDVELAKLHLSAHRMNYTEVPIFLRAVDILHSATGEDVRITMDKLILRVQRLVSS